MSDPILLPDGRLLRPIAGAYDGGAVAYIAIAATLVSAAVSAYAAYETGQTQAEVGRYQSKVAERNAEAAKVQAEHRARIQAEQDRAVRARARALYGAAGVEVDTGSPLLVDAYSARQAELNRQAIRYTGDIQSNAFAAQGVLANMEGKAAKRAGTIGAFSSLLGGAAQAGGQYYQFGLNKPRATKPSTVGGLGASYYQAGGGYYM